MMNCFQVLLSISTCAATARRLTPDHLSKIHELDGFTCGSPLFPETDPDCDMVIVRETQTCGNYMVGWCRLTVSKPVLKAPMVSALESII